MKTPPAIVYASALLLVSACPAPAQWDDLAQEDVRGHTMYTVFEPGFISAIIEPMFITAAQVNQLYHPDEPLIVVAGGEDVHAYGLWHMEEHLVVNDFIDGDAITTTW